MSILFTVDAIIKAPYNVASLHVLLQCITDLGWQCTYDKHSSNELDKKNVAIDIIAEKILTKADYQRNNPDWRGVSVNIDASHEGAHFSINFSEHNCLLMHVHICIYLERFYKQPYFLDWARYLQFLILICKDFEILELKTWEDEYFFYIHGDCKDPVSRFEIQPQTLPRLRRVDVTLLTAGNADHIETIMYDAESVGWKFFAYSVGNNPSLSLMRSITLEAATVLMVETELTENFMEQKPPTVGDCVLVGQRDDRYYILRAGMRADDQRTLSVVPLFNISEPTTEIATEIAVADALTLCEPFCILELITFDSWYTVYHSASTKA